MDLASGDAARMLATLQRLLEIPAAHLQTALTHAANAIADALEADKVDAFVYDDSRDTLVALGTSTQPLSSLQKKLGLDVLPISNGGRGVQVYTTGEVFRSGNLLDDPEELRGVKEGLRIRSVLGIPLVIGAQRRGVLMIASLEADHFSEADQRFAQSVAHWVAQIAHRAELVEAIERNALQEGRKAAADELITVLAHDLRNYVAPISSRLYVMRHLAQSRGDDDTLAEVQATLRGVARLSALITSLLDVSRLDRGLFALDLEPTDLADLINDAAASLSSAEHEIVVQASEPVVVKADASRLRQSIDNLLANAATHSPRGAPVNVFISRTEADGRTWGQVDIIDEGPGIADDMLPTIFDRFVTGRARSGGLGLGLYLARQVAIAHGGDLSVQSTLGQGARFVLRIPVYTEHPAIAP